MVRTPGDGNYTREELMAFCQAVEQNFDALFNRNSGPVAKQLSEEEYEEDPPLKKIKFEGPVTPKDVRQFRAVKTEKTSAQKSTLIKVPDDLDREKKDLQIQLMKEDLKQKQLMNFQLASLNSIPASINLNISGMPIIWMNKFVTPHMKEQFNEENKENIVFDSEDVNVNQIIGANETY